MTYELRDLNGKVVIITGATSGIGAAAARALVEKGCKVVLNARNETRLKEMVAELGESAIYVAGDCSEPDISRAVAKAAIDAWCRTSSRQSICLVCVPVTCVCVCV